MYRPVLDPIGDVLLPYSSRFEETAILTRNDPRDRDLVGKEGEEEWNRNRNSRSGFRAFRPDKTARYKWARILRRNKQPFDTARLIRIAPWGGEPRWDKEREKEWHERFWNGFWNGETATRHAPSMLRLYCCIVECAAKSGRGDPCYSNGERIKAARTQKRGAISVEITGREMIQK